MFYKSLLALAACAVTAVASAQMPPPPGGPRGPHMDRGHMAQPHRQHRPRKVWVPAHRERGRMVRGHYVYR